jgi:concentrative nucleoside transporter, CNT family
MKLALNVAAMLIAFLALIAVLNVFVGWVGGWFGQEWSLAAGLSYLFAPLAWIMGIRAEDCLSSGKLLGLRMVANEFIAYQEFSQWIQPDSGVELAKRSQIILTYALSGFANFGSIGIQIGGIGAMAPERQGDLARLGLRAMLGGTLATFMTACIAGILI